MNVSLPNESPPCPPVGMNLLLWRHAHAADGYPDASRPLTERGHRQAHKVAEWLASRLPADARIIVSPALRTRETAAALGRPFLLEARLAVGARPRDLLLAAGWPKAGGTVLLVGHQPTLGETVALLMTGTAAPWRVRKGALWWLEQPADAEAPYARALLDPRLL